MQRCNYFLERFRKMGISLSVREFYVVIMEFLKSGIGSHQRNINLASEFCRLPSVENKDLKNMLKDFMMKVKRTAQIMRIKLFRTQTP